MKINLTYTVKKNLIPDYYYEVLSCYGLSAKNIKNSSLFIIKNIFNSYNYNKELNIYTLKPNLHTNQRQELNLLFEYYQSIYNDKLISVSQERKLNITNDYIHKLSKCLIDECLNKGIKVIVVGKNKGWKQEINNGAKNNRDFYNFPHARFIETLKYKSLLKDIVVIEVDESYTSKTSFIDNEELMVYNNDRNKELVNSEEKDLTQGDENQLSKNKVKLSGKRINRKFITKDGKIIHADINGSFNIVRKVLFNLKYDKEEINIEYELMELNNHSKRRLNSFYNKYFTKNKKEKEVNCGLSGIALNG